MPKRSKKSKSKRVTLKQKYKVSEIEPSSNAPSRKQPPRSPPVERRRRRRSALSQRRPPPPPARPLTPPARTHKSNPQVIKKVKEHHRKKKKELKKLGNKAPKVKDPGIPAQWPFKEELIKELAWKRQQILLQEKEKKEERKRAREVRAVAGWRRGFARVRVRAAAGRRGRAPQLPQRQRS
jgi:hypothetical protein